MNVPSLNVPKTKLEKLADDLKKLSVETSMSMGEGASVPTFQRQGYLDKHGHSRSKWFQRFFVLRDSFLLAYNLKKSDFTVEPRAAIHLGGATLNMCEHGGKEFCFMIDTQQKDKFLFAAETEVERASWVLDLETAKQVTHANMVKLAVENQCLAEEKGAGAVALDNSTSSLAIFSNEDYITNTPITGGAEGWLRTNGFNPEEKDQGSTKGSFSMKKKTPDGPQKCYFILRDSHLLMFNGGDILTKPRGVMFLLGTHVETHDDRGGDGDYHFSVKSPECGDEIELIASTNKIRQRWSDALRIGSRVTYPDMQLLKKEHDLLAAVTMTPRAPPKINPVVAPPVEMPSDFVPISTTTGVDIQGEQLDPGVEQAYDAEGNPVLRDPEGKLVVISTADTAPAVLEPSTPRYNAEGMQLDPFNRPLPPGAVPMFDADGVPIGVGPDGKHYKPDGTTVEPSAPHFDSDGKQLDDSTITAADAISADLNVAIKVRTKLKGDGTQGEAVDALGRTFREGYDEKSGEGATTIKNADGVDVPLASARRIESSTGALVEHGEKAMADAAAKRDEGTKKASASALTIKSEDEEGNEKTVGTIEVTHQTTLSGVRSLIKEDLDSGFEEFVFLMNGVALLKYEERDRLATSCMPEIFIRGKELKAVASKNFSKKVEALQQKQETAKAAEDEFAAVMRRVREGKLLKQTNKAYLED